MTTHKLSPSDLTFLYNECPRCFYNKIKGIAKRPYQPFPSIFTKIDKCMRACYHGFNPQDLDPTLPTGTLNTETKRLSSAPIPLTVDGIQHQLIFTGDMDALASYNDGTVGVKDFKTSEVKPQYTLMYGRQLHVYRDILMYPKAGNPQVVSSLGLLCGTPERMSHAGGTALFEFKLQYVPVAIDDDWWHSFLVDAVRLLEGPEPDGGNCFWCKVQRLEAAQKLSA